ncbi:nitric oxide synthase oxygenase [Oscillatoria sp. CS-180]|uniref:nitric oxide synthase oxygenase n=1 Tax=Oscillatoria sp. CS-180 TaxID=3021720 RepID=UPI00232CB97D|nr:nitric oxide synthase oxygenase [Oscillatoria sp. CS-180]MDB9527480.1 nitric oxide synthase oxygenase [Oscillatoria sp. CS-180]
MVLSESSRSNAQPTSDSVVRIVEVSAIDVPETGEFKYKCRVTIYGEGRLRLDKNLMTRLQPNWLVDIKHSGDCTIALTLLYRQGGLGEPWQEADTVEFSTAGLFRDERSIDVECPITTWAIAPNLKLKARLTQSSSAIQNEAVSLSLATTQTNRKRPPLSVEDDVPVKLPEAIPLSMPEAVIVKDVWNKLRAWKELQMETFFKRLLLEVPELESLLGEALNTIPDYFFELFDCCVRQLCPHTEAVVWEPMMGVPIEKGDSFDTVEDYGNLFADIGLKPRHWLKARQVWMWMLPQIPYLEDYDRDNLAKGEGSALYKFFNTHVITGMVAARDRYDAALSPDIVQRMAASWQYIGDRKNEMGIEFYQTLFAKYPQVLPIFGRADMNYLSTHLLQSLEFLFICLSEGDAERLLIELRHLGRIHGNAGVPSFAYGAISDVMLILFEKYVPDFDDDLRQAWRTLIDRVSNVIKLPKLNEERLLKKAKEFLTTISDEQAWEESDREQRWQDIQAEVQATGTYTHTYEELAYGAQVSWRNASKCVGRIQWQNLVVRDCRHITDPDDMFRELEEHLRLATNGGNIQITMTAFRPKLPQERWGPRIWNPQLIRYAAYEMPDGSILGDAANLGVTQAITEKMGWQPPEPRTPYDILPLVIEVPGKEPKLYEFQKEDILEVEIEHPTLAGFKDLGLRWYAVPAISNFRMDIGGITYACIPFNGWYMGTEIARDFLEEWRYDKMEDVAKLLGLDTSTEATLWRDRVALEMNVAVIHSFQKAKVTMVDHQSAAQQFLTHDLREKKSGRECPADYGWVMPPAGGSACPVWHHQMRDFYLEPAYHHAADRWAVEADLDLEQFIQAADENEDRSDRILILYGSETGTAEGFARRAARQFVAYRPKVMGLDEYNTAHLASEKLLLVVTSTFGNGDMPGNAKSFMQWLKQQPRGALQGLNYSVLGIGSTIYEHFCAAGVALDKALAKAGANPIVPLHKGDEIKGQADTFKQWSGLVSRVLGADDTSASPQSLPKLTVTYLDAQPPSAPNSHRPIAVPLLSNRELLKEVIPGSRSTRCLMFDIANAELQYETGDHVAVHPNNPADLVVRLCRRLGVDPEAVFTARYVMPDGTELEDEPPVAGPTTVRQVLTEVIDLALHDPFRDLLTALHGAATSTADKVRLATWLEILALESDRAENVALRKKLQDCFMTIVDLFEEFPSAQITLEMLLELLPRLKPRLYSISSCPQLHPGKIQITVGVLQIKTDTGKTRQGLCSNYLAGLTAGDRVCLDTRTSDFRPPTDPTAPLLMVGPGTGISPLLAFLQHREHLQNMGVQLGDATLYFGCRNHSDFLYEAQLKSWLEQGVLSNLQVAFSRLTEQKVYVQTLMQQQAAVLWQQLSHPQCHYYVCGDARMADNVFDVFMQIAKTEGGLSHVEAVEFFDRMKQEKRFSTDVWGVTLNFEQAIKQVKKDNYARAEKWLANL